MKFLSLARWSFVLAAWFAGPDLGAAPSQRYNHSAIWTGSEMIVWGGNAADGSALGDGARYDPGSKTWTPISAVNAPVGRYDHTVVWTGTEMIIWGGRSSTFNYLTDGARYHPVSNQWFSLNPSGAPTPRVNHRSVWTGSEMIVWGGLRGDITYGNDGARYHPASNSWLPMTTNGAPAGRGLHSAVWTGDRMIVWGGNGGIFQGAFHDGGRYDPVDNSWISLSTNNGPAGRYVHATVWTGNEMIVWGGYDGAAYPASGGRYHAASDSWSVLPTLNAPSARGFASAIWTGTDMIVWGGADGTNRNTGGRYNLAANTWTATTTNSAPAARAQHTAIWSGHEMVVWAGRSVGVTYDDVGRYNPVGNSWTTASPGVSSLSAIFSGQHAAILGGLVNPNNTNTSAWFDWGTSTNYENRTPIQFIGTGTNDLPVAHLIQGIGGGPTYHFRAAASNSLGVAYGADISFSTPAFSNIQAYLPGEYPPGGSGAAAWGDYDNDGRLDILRRVIFDNFGKPIQVGRNTGSGFSSFIVPLPGLTAGSPVWGNYDNDGRLDFVVAGLDINGDWEFYMMQNTGSGFVEVNAGLPRLLFNSALAWGDYDHDGREDILLAGSTLSGNYVQLWRNTGNGFANSQVSLPVVTGAAFAWGDYDNDGRLDILLAGYSTNLPATQVLRNTGSGFTNINAGLPGIYNGSVAWGDYDNDGRLDILLAGYTTNVSIAQVWRNTASGFTNINAGLPGVSQGNAAWGDYDNDGRLDILLAGLTTNLNITQVWRNTGSGFSDINAGLPGVNFGSVAWGDYDNDGRLDILLTGQTNAFIEEVITQVWRNNTPQTNTPPTAPGALTFTHSNSLATLSWSAAADNATPAAGLTYNVRIGTTPGGSDALEPKADGNGFRRLPQLGNAQSGLTATFQFSVGTPYYWSVQAVDSALAGSPFSQEGSFKFQPVQVPISAANVTPGDLNGDGLVDQAELNVVLANYFLNSPFLQMTNVAGLGGTNVTFTLSNSTAGAFSVEVTTNLVDWNFLGPATPRYLFTDTNAPVNPQRYYRLRWP